MYPNNEQPTSDQEAKIDQILASVKKTERYQRISLWVTIVVFVLPIIAAIVVVPMAIRSYTSTLSGLL